MFTLKLSDLEITPRITSNDVIQDENEYAVFKKALLLVEEKFPGVYPNPVTLERKIKESIRNEDGLTSKEVSEKRLNQAIEKNKPILDGARQSIEDARKIMDEQLDKIRSEKLEKINALKKMDSTMTTEERESINVERDNIEFEYRKKEDIVVNEYNAIKKEINKNSLDSLFNKSST